MKESFLSHVENPTVMDSATETSNLFTIKTWTIMITSALSTGIIFAFLHGFFNESTFPEKPITREQQPTLIELTSHDLTLLELEESDWIYELENPSIYQPEFTQEEWVEQVKEPEIINPKELTHAPLVFQEKKEKVEDYRFPMLTKEEKKMYAKKKAGMIKSWVKRDKVQKFIPLGKLEYKGDSITINPFYMSAAEVTNFEYRTFLFDLLEQGRKEDFLIAKPDQSLWAKDYPEYNQPLVELYFSHPAYNEYPVNNISRAGAEMYCEWLTKATNGVLNSKNKPRMMNIRLPSNVEWDYAALGGNNTNVYPWGGPYVRNSTGCYLANFNPEGENPNDDGAMHTAAVYSYSPNGYGLYCMSGNIAEMVWDYKDKSIIGTKGGSFLSPLDSIQINAPMQHVGIAEPNVNIGFRVVSSYFNNSPRDHANLNQREKMGYYDKYGEFHYPYLFDTEKKNYAKSKKQILYKASNYCDANFGCIQRDTLLFTQDSVHFRDISIQTTEVTNLEYRTFLVGLLEQGRKKDYVEALPNQDVWKVDSNNIMSRLYFSYAGYNDYPVVGVTQKGIELYCEWYSGELKKEYNSTPKQIQSMLVRIPSTEEWELAASDKGKYKIYPWKGETLTDVDGNYLVNCYPIEGNYSVDGALLTNSIKSYPASPNNLYDMSGNVAEVTLNEKGVVVVKGGSWRSSPSQIQLQASQSLLEYPLPNSSTGFRPVLVYEYHYAREKYDKDYPPK